MRAYIPVGWEQLAAFDSVGRLEGPLRACAVDPSWRASDPEVDEEEWEFEAQLAAAEALCGPRRRRSSWPWMCPDPSRTASDSTFADGWVSLTGPISRRDTAAVLTTDLAWFGVQEIPGLLDR